MKYLTFEDLEICITRRCNMRPYCKHCYKGDAQDIDLSHADIDALINQTEMIGNLYITGGEPTICIESIQYLFEQIQKSEIPVFGFTIITNGLGNTDDVINLVRQWSLYVSECNRDYKGKLINPDQCTELRISYDKYHNHQYSVCKNIETFKNGLVGIAAVNIASNGQLPDYIGNAKKISQYRIVDYLFISQFQKWHLQYWMINTSLNV